MAMDGNIQDVRIPFLYALLLFTAIWLIYRLCIWIRHRTIEWRREAILLLMYFNLAVIIRFVFFPLERINGKIQPLIFSASNILPFKIILIPFVGMFDYLTKRIPVHPQDAEREKRRFVTMMVNAYADDPKNTVLAAEEELFAKHPSGIIVKGYPDRVEQDANGLDLIADFKTGRKVLHKDNDVASCLQVMLYAFILTDHEIDIRTCVYRYLRLRKRVRIDYTPENIAVMKESEKVVFFERGRRVTGIEEMLNDGSREKLIRIKLTGGTEDVIAMDECLKKIFGTEGNESIKGGNS